MPLLSALLLLTLTLTLPLTTHASPPMNLTIENYTVSHINTLPLPHP